MDFIVGKVLYRDGTASRRKPRSRQACEGDNVEHPEFLQPRASSLDVGCSMLNVGFFRKNKTAAAVARSGW
jgi:hypothetical protein